PTAQRATLATSGTSAIKTPGRTTGGGRRRRELFAYVAPIGPRSCLGRCGGRETTATFLRPFGANRVLLREFVQQPLNGHIHLVVGHIRAVRDRRLNRV